MTLDQKIADLHTAIHRLETQQSQILLMLNLYGLDGDVLRETKKQLDGQLMGLTQGGMLAHARINELQFQMSRLGAGR